MNIPLALAKGDVFWIVFLICVLVYGFFSYPFGRNAIGGLAIFILLGLVGWAVFGPIVQ